jgi:hypothetical protein
VQLPDAGSEQPRDVLGREPPPGITNAALSGVIVASRSSYPADIPRGEPADRTATSRGKVTSRRHERRGSSVESIARLNVHGTDGSLSSSIWQVSVSISRSASRNPNATPAAPQAR